MGPRRFAPVAAVVVVVGSTLLALPPAAAAPATRVVHVRPVTVEGHLKTGYSISAKHSGGNCWTSSQATGSAYRCMAHNLIYDPCWVGFHRAYVYCLPDGWSHQVVRLHVTEGYDNSGFPWKTSRYPWGLRVADGHRCSLVQGASGQVHGEGVSYGCDRKTVLLEEPNRSHATWRIQEARQRANGHYTVKWVDVTTAWFGRPTRRG